MNMSTILTTQNNTLNGAPLLRVAERWRPAGIYMAMLTRDGAAQWADPQMPRALSLGLTANTALMQHVRKLPENMHAQSPNAFQLLPGIVAHVIPVRRRRKITHWIVALMRTELVPLSEDLHRLAARASLDVMALAQQMMRMPLIPGATTVALAALIGQMYDDLGWAGTATQELSSVTEQLSAVYEEINLLYKISSGMRFSQKPETFLESVCREVQEIGSFQAVGVALTRTDDDDAIPTVDAMSVMVGTCSADGREIIQALHGPIEETLSKGETQIYNDIRQLPNADRLRAFTRRLACVPLIRDKRSLGVLLAIDKEQDAEFNSGDLKLLNNVGNQCSIFLENAALYQDMQGLFMGVLHALTRSIDAKDAYTRGHSQRVAELSRELAVRAGLSDAQCERIYLSGLLHDVGKIGVPEAVLTKPGRLTDAEFDAIKKHPAIGAQILGNIKQLQDIIPGVLYHHERWDGKGYPYGLAKDDIPLMGRIICVADSFDAMSSTRTYRPALPLDTVLGEIRRCAGSQFDPKLAELFVALDFAAYRRAIEEQFAAVAPLAEAGS